MGAYSCPDSSLPINHRQALAEAGFDAGREYFNGQPERFRQYLTDKDSSDQNVATVGRLATHAALYMMASILEQATDKGLVSFDGHQPPTATEFLYISIRNEADVYAPNCSGVIISAVDNLRTATPSIRASKKNPEDVVEKIEIVGTPNKEVETKYERDRQTMEITKSTATQKTAPASSPANAAP